MPDFPTGTVTFLFSDIEGSTKLWDRHPDSMPDALRLHDATTHGIVADSGGTVVKHTGDGFYAVFASAVE